VKLKFLERCSELLLTVVGMRIAQAGRALARWDYAAVVSDRPQSRGGPGGRTAPPCGGPARWHPVVNHPSSSVQLAPVSAHSATDQDTRIARM
jgi:hypothetical protein